MSYVGRRYDGSRCTRPSHIKLKSIRRRRNKAARLARRLNRSR